MRRSSCRPWCVALGLLLTGCTYDLPLSSRPSHRAVQEARALAVADKGPIAIEWSPATFPDRVDMQGPSGSEGAATRARIPTGPALSGRLDEILDVAVGVDPRSGKVLTVSVRDARTEYVYALGSPFNRRIGEARCVFEAEFAVGDARWEQRFSAVAREGATTRGSGLVEQVWDDVVLQAASAVLESGLLDTTTARAEPPAGAEPVSAGNASEPMRDPRLERLISAWPHLNESTRSRIIGIIEGAELASGDR